MGTSRISLALTAALLPAAFLTAPVSAQDPPARPGEQAAESLPRVAVVDVQRILDNHPRLKGLLDELQKDKHAFEQTIRVKLDQVKKIEQQKKAYVPGSPEYARLEEDVLRGEAEIGVQLELKKREFTAREAQIYFRVHDEIVKAVAFFADRYNLDLVLNKQGGSVDPLDIAAVQQAIQRRVVWHRKEIDITDKILDQLMNPQPNPNPVRYVPRRRN